VAVTLASPRDQSTTTWASSARPEVRLPDHRPGRADEREDRGPLWPEPTFEPLVAKLAAEVQEHLDEEDSDVLPPLVDAGGVDGRTNWATSSREPLAASAHPEILAEGPGRTGTEWVRLPAGGEGLWVPTTLSGHATCTYS
jgi:hypothetical protein